MDSLKRLAGGAFSLHYVLLLAAANFPKPLFDHFVAQLEIQPLLSIFTKTPTKDLERKLRNGLMSCAQNAVPAIRSRRFCALLPTTSKNMAGKSRRNGPIVQALHAAFDAAIPHPRFLT